MFRSSINSELLDWTDCSIDCEDLQTLNIDVSNVDDRFYSEYISSATSSCSTPKNSIASRSTSCEKSHWPAGDLDEYFHRPWIQKVEHMLFDSSEEDDHSISEILKELNDAHSELPAPNQDTSTVNKAPNTSVSTVKREKSLHRRSSTGNVGVDDTITPMYAYQNSKLNIGKASRRRFSTGSMTNTAEKKLAAVAAAVGTTMLSKICPVDEEAKNLSKSLSTSSLPSTKKVHQIQDALKSTSRENPRSKSKMKACERERERVRIMNEFFDDLVARVPGLNEDSLPRPTKPRRDGTKSSPSKIIIMEQTVRYINELEKIIKGLGREGDEELNNLKTNITFMLVNSMGQC